MNVHEEAELRRFLDRMASEVPVAPIATAPAVARAKRGFVRNGILLAILSLLIAGAAVAASRAALRSGPQPYGQAPPSALSGLAVIARHGQLMMVSPSGSTPLTTDGVWAPIGFSPDGTTLLAERLSAFRPGPNYGMPGYHPGPSPTRAELVTIRLDTRRQTTLGRITPDEAYATWSPDGRSIASVDDGRLSIIDVATGTASIAAEHLVSQQVSWSPDGSVVLYVGFRGHRTGIFTVTADGTDRTAVLIEQRCIRSHRVRYCDGPQAAAWSPDGTSIAYSEDTHHRNGRRVARSITVMGTDGSNAHQVSDVGTDELEWSPDGSSIGFVSYRGGVYMAAADGSGWRELAAFGFNVRWSSDGSMVSFGCQSGICLRQLDEIGSPMFPLSDHTSSQNSGTVAWQPVR
jgi:hypothetical protein